MEEGTAMNRRPFRFGIRTKLNLFTVVVVVLLTIIVYGFVIPMVEREKRGERENKLRAVVETAVSLMAHYEDAVRTYQWKTDSSLPRTREEAQEKVLAYLRPLRYEKDEHIFILDSAARMIMHPLKPDLQGRDLSAEKAPDGSQPFRDMAFEAQRRGSVFVNYIWFAKWSQTVSEPQTTCARYFYPWDWVVCSSLYTQDIDDAVRTLKCDAALVLGFGAILAWGILYVIASLVARPIVALAQQVSQVTGHANTAAAGIIAVRGNDEIGDLANAFRQTLDDLRQAIARLRENEESLRTTLDSIGDAVIATDAHGNVARMNPVAEALTGWRSEEARGRPMSEVFRIVNALTRVPAANPVSQVIANGRVVGIANHTVLLCRDGTEHPIADSAAPIRSAAGVITGVVLVFRDVTEEYRMRRALADSESRFRALVESSADLIWEMDRQGVYTYISPRVREVLGYSPDEVLGKTPFDRMPADEADRFGTLFRERVAAGQPIIGLEHVNRHKDGRLMVLETNGTPICDGAGDVQGYRGVDRDITERKRVEKENVTIEAHLRQSQKMEAVGQLAGGVAHDFNNLLQAILGYAELALDTVNPDARESVEMVLKAGRRAATLVRQLLAFSRQQVLDMRDVDLNEVIADMIKMIRRVIGEHIVLDVVPGLNLGIVRADKGQIEQILMNLCLNARDAMPEGGRIVIETEAVVIDETFCRTHAWALPGRYACLSITDCGCGMDEKTLASIFEPFFTTKVLGQGTGLGLATVYGLVKQHHGLVNVLSEIGKGSTFRIYIPLTGSVAVVVSEEKSEPCVRSGSETILVAEDDEVVRMLTRAVLSGAGYQVHMAEDGEVALRLFDDLKDCVDLVLLDVVMPKLGGRAVYERIRAQRPQVPVIFCTGYSLSAIHTNFVLDEGLRLIQKPYRPNDLLRKVREVLDGAATARSSPADRSCTSV
ncbi:MAG: PAS domain S-box protein [Lentisphaerae bacterium]|nr:PAS domain S-box protein [Lentisphaerota bacterium]